MGYGIPCDPRAVYLGLIPEGMIGKEDIYLFKILTLQKAITKNWLKSDPPEQTLWVDIVDQLCSMERLTYCLRTKEGVHQQRWEKWYLFKRK